MPAPSISSEEDVVRAGRESVVSGRVEGEMKDFTWSQQDELFMKQPFLPEFMKK